MVCKKLRLDRVGNNCISRFRQSKSQVLHRDFSEVPGNKDKREVVGHPSEEALPESHSCLTLNLGFVPLLLVLEVVAPVPRLDFKAVCPNENLDLPDVVLQH